MKIKFREDQGVSVLELTIAIAIFMVLMLSVFRTMDAATKSEKGQQVRNVALLDLRGAMTRVTREVRQTTVVNPASTQSLLDVQTYTDGNPIRVQYSLSGSSFRRTLCPNKDFASACGGTPYTITDRITTTAPFCYDAPACNAPSPPAKARSVRVTLALAPFPSQPGTGTITLSTDLDLRNVPA